MAAAQEKILAYENQFHEFLTQVVEGVDCVVNPLPVISENDNLVTLKLTQGELLELLSSIQVGSEWAYPDKSHQIMFNFMRGLICPPILEDETGDCLNYPNYAPFITYAPSNPYNQPDYIPPDYVVPPFMINTAGEYPFAFGYLATDIFVPLSAVSIDPVDMLTLNYPTITVTVVGSGQIELDLLAVQQGGYIVIKIGSMPNIADILGEIIIESGLVVIDLDNDSVSIPPETDIIISEEINIEAAAGVETTVYMVFLPKLNDSLIPLGFGGGIRQIGLCGFEAIAGEGTVQDVRYNETTGDLEKFVAGEWVVFATCEQLVACAPTVGGGGGGGAITIVTGQMSPSGTGSTTTTSTSFVDIAGCNFAHTPTRSNMLVICENIMVVNSSTNQPITMRIVRGGGGAGLDANEVVAHNLSSLPVAVSERFAVTAGVAATIELQWKVSAGTATKSDRQTINITIIEYDNAEDLFVEDVRISGRELQKKIGGIWITVSDSLDAILDSIDAQISSIVAVNTSQQNQINNIVSVNASQTSQIAALDTRIDSLEVWKSDVDLSIAGLNAIQIDHENRIDALELAVNNTGQEVAYKEWDFRSSDHGFTHTTGSWISGQGFVFSDNMRLQLPSGTLFDGRVTHMKMNIRKQLGGFGTMTIEWADTSGFSVVRLSGGTLLNSVWSQVSNRDSQPTLVDFLLSNFTGEHRLEGLKLLGRGTLGFL